MTAPRNLPAPGAVAPVVMKSSVPELRVRPANSVPERPVFGTIRFMSSANTVRMVAVRQYLARYARAGAEGAP